MTMQELATQYLNYFKTSIRDNGEQYLYTDVEENSNLYNLIHAAHLEDMLPNDYSYQFIYEALEAISEHNDFSEINIEADPYNYDLIKWVGTNAYRADLVDEMVEQFGYENFYQAISNAQAEEKRQVLVSVFHSLQNILSENGK